jgi:hypothetical protein
MLLNRITLRQVLTELIIQPVPYRRIARGHDAWPLVQHVVCVESWLCYRVSTSVRRVRKDGIVPWYLPVSLAC